MKSPCPVQRQKMKVMKMFVLIDLTRPAGPPWLAPWGKRSAVAVVNDAPVERQSRDRARRGGQLSQISDLRLRGVGEHPVLFEHSRKTYCGMDLSVKNQRFLPALLEGEPRGAQVFESACVLCNFCCLKSISMKMFEFYRRFRYFHGKYLIKIKKASPCGV